MESTETTDPKKKPKDSTLESTGATEPKRKPQVRLDSTLESTGATEPKRKPQVRLDSTLESTGATEPKRKPKDSELESKEKTKPKDSAVKKKEEAKSRSVLDSTMGSTVKKESRKKGTSTGKKENIPKPPAKKESSKKVDDIDLDKRIDELLAASDEGGLPGFESEDSGVATGCGVSQFSGFDPGFDDVFDESDIEKTPSTPRAAPKSRSGVSKRESNLSENISALFDDSSTVDKGCESRVNESFVEDDSHVRGRGGKKGRSRRGRGRGGGGGMENILAILGDDDSPPPARAGDLFP